MMCAQDRDDEPAGNEDEEQEKEHASDSHRAGDCFAWLVIFILGRLAGVLIEVAVQMVFI